MWPHSLRSLSTLKNNAVCDPCSKNLNSIAVRPSFHEHLLGGFRGRFCFWTGEQFGPSKWKGELTLANSLLPPFGTPTTKRLCAHILGTPLCRSLDITSWVASLTTSHFRDSEIARPRLVLSGLEIFSFRRNRSLIRSLQLPWMVLFCSIYMFAFAAWLIFVIEMKGALHGLDTVMKFSTNN